MDFFLVFFFFFQAEDGIRDWSVTGVQTCALPISGAYVNSAVTEALLGANSRLDRVKLQCDGGRAIHLYNFQARLGERAILRDCTVTSGAGVTRQQGFISFEGEHADAKIAGAYLLR